MKEQDAKLSDLQLQLNIIELKQEVSNLEFELQRRTLSAAYVTPKKVKKSKVLKARKLKDKKV